MPRIMELSPHVADLIAAGEVVERPGSVVKELMENSIDAGASTVTVEIKNGGMRLIRVSDNGCGISREDAATAFLRHATSKLRTGDDLAAIATLGFRGEALAAIAAVSHIELITRTAEEDEGTRLLLTAGVVDEQLPVGCPPGTTVMVRDLFFNTPARLKYMKKDSAEGANAANVAARAALSNPAVSVRFIRDGKEELHTPGDGRLDSCIYSVFGRDFAQKLMLVEGENVKGYISRPEAGRGNRGQQHFFLNGRHIKSQLLQAALEQAYKNVIMVGKFPACILHIDTKPSEVDVNVHPAKTEVRFSDEKRVFDAVYFAVKSALEAETPAPKVKDPREGTGVFLRMRAEEVRKSGWYTGGADAQNKISGSSGGVMLRLSSPSASSVRQSAAAWSSLPASEPKRGTKADIKSDTRTDMKAALKTEHVSEQAAVFVEKESIKAEPQPFSVPAEAPAPQLNNLPEAPKWRLIGEAMSTYIIIETERRVVFIDKHAAHERILFDRLKSEEHRIMSQSLLAPVVAHVGITEAELLFSELPLMERLGFDLGDFGGGAVIVRALPEGVPPEGAESLLGELAEKLSRGNTLSEDDILGGLLESVACKAAIKAGMKNEPDELGVLVERVLSGEIKYCPHGRPVSFELTQEQLERRFKRTV